MENNNTYRTHWHSFWFGFMSALSVVLCIILIFTITKTISFNRIAPKSISVDELPTENNHTIAQNADLTDIAKSLDIDENTFTACMDEKRYAQKVDDSIANGTKAGIQGTPTSFVLIDDAVYVIEGAIGTEDMKSFLDDLLAGKDTGLEDMHEEVDLTPLTDEDYAIGPDTARITIIEYSDVDCPYCKLFHSAVTAIRADYANDVRWVFRHMPSDNLHPDARTKAEAAECIGAVGGGEKFWRYIDTMLAEDM